MKKGYIITVMPQRSRYAKSELVDVSKRMSEGKSDKIQRAAEMEKEIRKSMRMYMEDTEGNANMTDQIRRLESGMQTFEETIIKRKKKKKSKLSRLCPFFCTS